MSRRRRDRARAPERREVTASDTPASSGKSEALPRLVFTRWTGLFGGAGLVTVLVGFFLLAQGSLALAPALLVVGFLGFFPLALVK